MFPKYLISPMLFIISRCFRSIYVFSACFLHPLIWPWCIYASYNTRTERLCKPVSWASFGWRIGSMKTSFMITQYLWHSLNAIGLWTLRRRAMWCFSCIFEPKRHRWQAPSAFYPSITNTKYMYTYLKRGQNFSLYIVLLQRLEVSISFGIRRR